MRRRLPACLLVTVALAAAGVGAAAADKPVERPPTQLWNAFPLREKPEPVEAGVAAASVTRLAPAPRPTSVPLVAADGVDSDSAERLTTVVLLLELALMLAAIGVAIVVFRPDLNAPAFARAPWRRQLSIRALVGPRRREPRRERPATPPLMPRLPRPAPVPVPVPVPVVESADEHCRVYWRPGYVSAQFVAKVSPQTRTAIAVSPAFRWRKAAPPIENDVSAPALAAIVHELEQEGWIAAGRNGREWFELEFVRPRTAADACRIEWTHDYVSGRFRAVVTRADGSRTVVAESSDLRSLRGRPPERGKPAYGVFDELTAKLARLGWTASGRGDEWYSVAFVRTPPTAAGVHRRRPDRET